MTTLIAWVAIDSSGPSALYFASDSRITWDGRDAWDCCRKIFLSRTQPEIFGFYGDVLFPSLALAQTVSTIDLGLLYGPNDGVEVRFSKVSELIERLHEKFPARYRADFSVIHGVRSGTGTSSQFQVHQTSYRKNGFERVLLKIQNPSGIVGAFGTGASCVQAELHRWKKSDVGGTSRAVFSAFVDSVVNTTDACTGGAPQVGVLRRSSCGKELGLLLEEKRFLAGMIAGDELNINKVEWYNAAFERCEPDSGKLKPSAQPQPRPTNLR